MIKSYITNPVTIEAIEYTGDNTEEILVYMNVAGIDTYQDNRNGVLYIKTLEGTMRASVGDFVIKGMLGEFYPCKPEVFNAKYTELTEDS